MRTKIVCLRSTWHHSLLMQKRATLAGSTYECWLSWGMRRSTKLSIAWACRISTALAKPFDSYQTGFGSSAPRYVVQHGQMVVRHRTTLYTEYADGPAHDTEYVCTRLSGSQWTTMYLEPGF